MLVNMMSTEKKCKQQRCEDVMQFINYALY